MQKTLVIGDIHGCYYELCDLLARVGVGADWNVISLGDMVDRGPFTKDVVRYFKDTPNARAVLGNHENKNIRIFEGETELQGESQIQTLKSYHLSLDYTEHMLWFKTLPLYIELEQCYLAHGYVEPNIAFADQQKRVLIGALSGWRYLEKYNMANWQEQYDLQLHSKPVIVGHTVVGNMAKCTWHNNAMKVIEIDTGCVYGGYLTGVELPSWKVYCVKARQVYWQSAARFSEQGTAFPVKGV